MTATGREVPMHSVALVSIGSPIRLGLTANWRQFSLLVVMNAFVGAMVGLERAVLPVVAASEFAKASAAVTMAFIAAFGLAKALTNLAAGELATRRGRRFTLIVGWLAGLPVPLIVLWAPSWWWIVAANVLLGINQGLAWSATVVMKIDLAGPQRRGLAMGLNESAGYMAVAGAALLSGALAATYGLRTGPAYAGIGIAVVGLLASVLFVRETAHHATLEERSSGEAAERPPRVFELLRRSMWSDRGLFSASQAGLVNNLNDGLAWGIFPLLFMAAGLSLGEMSRLVAIYPAVWSICQIAAGPLSDRWGRKWLIVIGMIVQGIALIAMARSRGVSAWSGSLAALGLGTALVYPTLLAAVADMARPSWRSAAVGVYRLWRDLGYVVGAVVAGLVADALGVAAAIAFVGGLTVLSGLVVAVRFPPSLSLTIKSGGTK